MSQRLRRLALSQSTDGGIQNDEFWPAFSDVAMSLVLLLTFALIVQFVELSQVFEDLKTKRAQRLLWEAMSRDTYFGPLVQNGLVGEEHEGGFQRFRFSGDIVFDTGSAELRPRGREILQSFAYFISEKAVPDLKLEVEGHTDRQAVRGARYADNWELSAERALTVVRLFSQLHQDDPARMRFPPKNLSAIGYGELRPLEDKDGSEMNRRVEIRLNYSSK